MPWTRICRADEVAANSVRKFHVGGIPILLINYGQGFRAVPPVCPHMEEPLEDSGIVAKCVLTCSKHLWAWNLATLEMQGETERPLKTYDLKQEAGDIFAKIAEELIYEFEEGNDESDDDFFN